MTHRTVYTILCSAIFLLCTACGQNGKEKQSRTASAALENEAQPVEYEVLQRSIFAEEILSNGILSSAQKADIKWDASDIIAKIYVKNGDKVAKGQLLAELSHERPKMTILQSQDSKDRAYLEMQDFHIGQGYKLSDTTRIPQNLREIARIKSGYRQAELSYMSAQQAMEKTYLRAPFSGTIANMNAKVYNTAFTGEVFCLLLGHSTMEVTFPLMEKELTALHKGDKVAVSLYSDNGPALYGSVSTVNPLVGEDGLATVTALVQKVPDNWLDGMKVRVSIQRTRTDELVVPKSAVVIRDGKRVIFTIKNGRAYWNYVKLGKENSRFYTITDGLQTGDSVIVRGNTHLAHLAPIKITSHTSR